MFPTTFFPSWYFPPAYYAPGTSPSNGNPPPAVGTYTDKDAFSAMNGLLQATGAFANVLYGIPVNRASTSGYQYPFAVIQPTSWMETRDSDGSSVLRIVSFSLTLAVRDPQAGNRVASLDRLTTVVRSALNGSTLGGGCLPSQTQLFQGRLDPTSQPPEGRVVLNGQFAYHVASA
jgi:hypothetical protein